MAVLTRDALEGSPLADLHTIARELGIDGFRRLRKAALVDAILDRQDGDGSPAASDADTGEDEDAPKPRRSRGARGGRGRRSRTAEEDGATDEDAGADTTDAPDEDEDEAPAPRRRRGRGSAAADRDTDADRDDRGDREERAPRADRADRSERGDRADRADRGDRAPREDRIVEGTVELLGNGSGFLRVAPPEASDDDVYISAAQVRRCELVSGDQVTGPLRPPRRSERYPSLVRIDTINGKPADEVAEGTPFDDLPAAWPSERLTFGSEDPTLKAIEWLTPVGRGSRVVIAGESLSGKSEALRRIAGALAGQEGLELLLVLAGVRPEETTEWAVEPTAALTVTAGPDAQTQAIERAIDTGRRIAARGGNAVVLVDSLDDVEPRTARRLLASARNIADGGSLTIIATSTIVIGGETTVIALDELLTRTARFPALDLVESGTLRAELLVGDAGAEAIAAARIASIES